MSPTGQILDSYELQARAGRDLQTVGTVDQGLAARTLPLLGFYGVDSLAGISPPSRFVGVDLELLLRTTNSKALPNDGNRLRGRLQRLGVEDGAGVLVLLTGLDKHLERLWEMDRRPVWDLLASARIAIVTGPTYSVCADSHDRPASHNVMMLHRHHRLMQEAVARGLPFVPNLYWRVAEDRNTWTRWLNANPTVGCISTDLSRTKSAPTFETFLAGLLEIIDGVTRQLHVILVGVGPATAPSAIARLAASGATCTILTKAPLLSAINHEAYSIEGGRIRTQSSDASPRGLAQHNLRILERFLVERVSELSIYSGRELSNRPSDLDRAA